MAHVIKAFDCHMHERGCFITLLSAVQWCHWQHSLTIDVQLVFIMILVVHNDAGAVTGAAVQRRAPTRDASARVITRAGEGVIIAVQGKCRVVFQNVRSPIAIRATPDTRSIAQR